jgi:hypothetical protein
MLPNNTGMTHYVPAFPFHALLRFSDWLWDRTGLTHGLTPEMLVDHLFAYLCGACAVDAVVCRSLLLADYQSSGARARPRTLRDAWPGASSTRGRPPRSPLLRRQHHHADGATTS